LETAATLAKETAEATFELQKQIKLIVNSEKVKVINERLFNDLNALEGYEDVLAKQNELVGNHPQLSTFNLSFFTSQCRTLRKPQDKLIKQLLDVIATAAKEYQLNKNKDWKGLNLKEQLDQLKALQQKLSGNPDEEEPGLLHDTEYFWKQALWLQSRFPDGVYTDVEGLCKVVTQKEIEAKDWSLSPGRYVGVDTATDVDFDYEERLNEIHIELEGLNEEAIALANAISENYKELAI
jgi:type I restriction enzyme M protein